MTRRPRQAGQQIVTETGPEQRPQQFAGFRCIRSKASFVARFFPSSPRRRGGNHLQEPERCRAWPGRISGSHGSGSTPHTACTAWHSPRFHAP